MLNTILNKVDTKLKIKRLHYIYIIIRVVKTFPFRSKKDKEKRVPSRSSTLGTYCAITKISVDSEIIIIHRVHRK